MTDCISEWLDGWTKERRRCKEVREAQTGCRPTQAKGNVSPSPSLSTLHNMTQDLCTFVMEGRRNEENYLETVFPIEQASSRCTE